MSQQNQLSVNSSNSSSSSSAGTANAVANDAPEDTLTPRGIARNCMAALFAMHVERRRCLERSKKLNNDMKRAKSILAQFIDDHPECNGKLVHSQFGKAVKRCERPVHYKVTRATVLDWVEREFGPEVRREYDQRIQSIESQVSSTRVEYRITSLGLRRRGERVADRLGPAVDDAASDNDENENDDQQSEHAPAAAAAAPTLAGAKRPRNA